MNYNLPPDEGEKKRGIYWNVCIILGLISVAAFTISANMDNQGKYSDDGFGYDCADGQYIPGAGLEHDGDQDCDDGSDEDGNSQGVFADVCGGAMCCCSLIFAISALSTKNDSRRIMVVQQQPQYVPVIQQVRTVVQPPAPKPKTPDMFAKTKEMWIAEAQNLELARNWEDAAGAYQKAGMYEEAGRIRQEHLEQSQPMVQIGHVGNTVLNDSVMIAESTPKTCASCGNVSEPSWKICPHCSNPL